MAYAYCRGCTKPLDAPSIKEAIVGHLTCDHCQLEYKLDEFTRIQEIDEFTDRVDAIEKVLSLGEYQNARQAKA